MSVNMVGDSFFFFFPVHHKSLFFLTRCAKHFLLFEKHVHNINRKQKIKKKKKKKIKFNYCVCMCYMVYTIIFYKTMFVRFTTLSLINACTTTMFYGNLDLYTPYVMKLIYIFAYSVYYIYPSNHISCVMLYIMVSAIHLKFP